MSNNSVERSRSARGKIDVSDRGFCVSFPKFGEFSLEWNRVLRIVALKRDLLTTDLVCFQFFYRDDLERIIEANEEMDGFYELTRALIARRMIASSWQELVVKPAFHANSTVLFDATKQGLRAD